MGLGGSEEAEDLWSSRSAYKLQSSSNGPTRQRASAPWSRVRRGNATSVSSKSLGKFAGDLNILRHNQCNIIATTLYIEVYDLIIYPYLFLNTAYCLVYWPSVQFPAL